jgi:hypothetical protein
MRQPTRLLVLFIAFACANVQPKAASAIVADGDASIAQDGSTWTLTAGGATLTLSAGASRDFDILRLTTAPDIAWTIGSVPDTTITVGGLPLAFGSRAAGFAFVSAGAHAEGSSLQLDAVYELSKASLQLTRHYRIASGSPTFETWTTYASRGSSPPVANLNAVHIAVAAGTIHWLTGLQGDNADVENDGTFTLEETTLAAGGHFALGAQARASEQSVPWVAIDGPHGEVYAALMWSGAWSLTADRVGNALALDFGLANMATSIGANPVDGPHALFGVTAGGLPQATAALRSYIIDGIRGGRPFPALVTYNTFSHQIAIAKRIRDAVPNGAAQLLTTQAEPDDGPAWDVLQQTAAGARQLLVSAVQFDDGVQRWSVKPAGLDPSTVYDVTSVDVGVIGTATGADLMADGIEVRQSSHSAAHILIVTAKAQ